MSIKNRIAATILCLLVISLTAGCLGERSTSPISATPPGVVLNFHRTGGIAGVDDRLVVFNNGMAVLSTKPTGRNFQLSDQELSRIVRLFESAEFYSLEGNYTTRHSGADLMRYRITYYNKTVIADDSTAPASLHPVIDELNTIINTGRSPDSLSGLPVNFRS